jgi:hypothetical protein
MCVYVCRRDPCPLLSPTNLTDNPDIYLLRRPDPLTECLTRGQQDNQQSL